MDAVATPTAAFVRDIGAVAIPSCRRTFLYWGARDPPPANTHVYIEPGRSPLP